MAQLTGRRTGVHQYLQDLLDRTIQEAAPPGEERPCSRVLSPHLLERASCASEDRVRRLLQPPGDGAVKRQASAFLSSEWRYEIHNGFKAHRSSEALEGSQIRALGPRLVRGDGGLGSVRKLREPALCETASLTEVSDRTHVDILIDIFLHDKHFDLTPWNQSRCNLMIWVEKGRSGHSRGRLPLIRKPLGSR